MRLRLRNAGTGRMPVEVAALAGDRFDDDGKPVADYREVRVTVVLGAGEAKVVEILSSFEPDRVIVDPDARVLQLQREAAIVRF